QVSGPVVTVGLVLSAVFIPCAFISGITGLFFRQFALTIAVSTIISAFNSLTLSPALTALLLRPIEKHAASPLPRLAFPLFVTFGAYWWGSSWLVRWLLPMAILPVDIILTGAPIVTGVVGALVGWLVSKPLNKFLAFLFRGFNAGFRAATTGYAAAVGKVL